MPRHETTDASAPGVMGFVAAFVVGAIVLHFALRSAFEKLKAQTRPQEHAAPALVAERTPPPEPRFQVDSNLLNSYGWIDRRAQIVHIPIDTSMEILSHGR
jgi:hypothetical protein